MKQKHPKKGFNSKRRSIMKQFCKRFMVHLLVIAMVICALPVSMLVMKVNAETTADATAKLRIFEGRETGYFAGGLYLQSGLLEDAPGTNSTYAWYTPVSGEGGAYYHDTLVSVSLGKYADNATDGYSSWFLDISKDNTGFRQLVAGECITIKGKFSYEEYVVDFEEVTFRYEGGTTWSKVYQAPEGTEQITWTDFGLKEGSHGVGNTSSGTYNGSLVGKKFSFKMSRECETGNAMIYYGSSAKNYWNSYRVLIDSNGNLQLIYFFDDSNTKTFYSGLSLSKYGVDTEEEMVIDLYIEQVNKDDDDVYDANLILVINEILITEDTYVEDAWSLSGSSILLYGGSDVSITVADADPVNPVEQITLSDFNLAEGLRENDEYANYSAGVAGKEFVADVKVERGTTGNANFYYGGSSPAGGVTLYFRNDGVLFWYDESETLCYIDLNGMQISSGDTFRLSLLMTYVDSDNDGKINDANLEIKINGTSKYSGVMKKNWTIGGYIYFYPGANNTMSMYSVEKKETTPQISLDDFGIDDGTYGNAESETYGTCSSAIAGKRFVVEVTPQTSTSDNYRQTMIYYGASKEGAWDGLRFGVREDGLLVAHNTTGLTSANGVANGSFLMYPSMSTYGASMGQPFTLELFLDFVDYDEDGNEDDAYFRVKVNGKVAMEDYFVDAALVLGNSILLYGNEGNTMTLAHVLEEGEVLNPFKFTGVDEDSYIDEDTGDAVIEVAPSIGIPGNPDVEGYENVAVYNGLPVLVGDATEATTYEMTKTDHGTFRFTIPKDSVPELPFIITLQAGAMKNADETVELNLTTDYVVYVNNYGISGDAYITCAGEDVQLTYSSGDVNGIYLTTDSMTVTGWTGANIYAKDDANSGFFLNGERHQEVYLKKTADGTYYVALSDVELVPEDGDVAIITGEWELDTVFVDFKAIALKYNGSAWEKLEAENGVINGGSVSRDISDDEWLVDGANATVNGDSVEQGTVLYKPGDYVINSTIGDVTMSQTVSLYHPGDVNADNTYEVADLVRVKKHQNNNSADTVAGQLAADNAELTDLRKTLIGKTKTDAALPTEIVGATTVGTYITGVDATANGTTVISMADADNGYQATANNFDDYGFDYVIDYNNERPIKILQLTDTQTIDSSQERYPERLDAGSEQAWAPTEEIRNALLFDYIKETVEAAKPDLILLTGDIVYGEFDDNGENFKDIVEYMDSLKIPWAPVYGNHENESRMGVEWQNEQLTKSPYCLFNARHDIEGNGNYSIGISHNGTLERVVYMMDSNGVYDPWWEVDKYKDTEEAKNADTTVIKQTQGFSMKQKNWYRTMALRTNDIAGKTIPSIIGYHIPHKEYLDAAKAACYQTTDSSEVKYTIGTNVVAQPGDSGYKGNAHSTREEAHLLDYMHEVGTDGTFVGHQHSINTSVYYDGIRWTFGVKTGEYCDYPSEMGGTLIKFSDNSSTFEVDRIIVNP